MADVYKGLTIQFGAETRGLDEALRDINKQARSIGSELRKVDNALKFNPGSTELLKQKQALLAKQVENTRTRLDALKQAQEKLGEKDVNDDQYRALQREIIETGSKLKNLEGKAKDTDKALRVSPEVEAGFGRIRGAAGKVAIAITAVGAAAGAAFAAMTGKVVDNADELQKQADITGLSAERLQELQYIGSNLGVELDTITGAQGKLIKSMSAAQGGSKSQAAAFKALGINVVDGNGKLRDSKTVMEEAFSALGKVKNETERTALAQKIFGKGAAALNPILGAGGDQLKDLAKQARDTGAVMSNDTVASLDSFGDSMDNLKTAIMGTFGDTLAPALEKATPQLQKIGESIAGIITYVTENSSWIAPLALGLLGIAASIGLIVGAVQLATVIQTAWTGVTAAATAAQWLFNAAMSANPIGLIVLAVIALIAAIVLLWKNWDKVKAFAAKAFAAIGDAFSAMGDKLRSIGGSIKAFFVRWGLVLLSAVLPMVGLPILIAKNWPKILTAAKDVFGKVVSFIREQIDKIKGFFTKLVLKFPKIKMPHFKLTGEFSLKPPKVPKLTVDWYASGGSFAPGSPALIGVGDQRRGYEHVLRDDQIVSLMKRALGGATGGGQRPVVIQINQPVQSYSDIRRAVRDAAEELAW